MEPQRQTHFLVRWAKWYGPAILIALVLWFSFEPDIHGDRDPLGPALMILAILGISYWFLWRKPKGAP